MPISVLYSLFFSFQITFIIDFLDFLGPKHKQRIDLYYCLYPRQHIVRPKSHNYGNTLSAATYHRAPKYFVDSGKPWLITLNIALRGVIFISPLTRTVFIFTSKVVYFCFWSPYFTNILSPYLIGNVQSHIILVNLFYKLGLWGKIQCLPTNICVCPLNSGKSH